MSLHAKKCACRSNGVAYGQYKDKDIDSSITFSLVVDADGKFSVADSADTQCTQTVSNSLSQEAFILKQNFRKSSNCID